MPFSQIPAELKALRQWVTWRFVIRTNEKGETTLTKPPFSPHAPATEADVTDPSTWGTFDDAFRCMQENESLVDGIGFVFTDQDEYFGIDIDDEAKVEQEQLDHRRRVANDILTNVPSYSELSPSGNGIHIIARGRLPQGAAGKRNSKLQIEVYGAKRFFTMTGRVFNRRTAILDGQAFLDKLYEGFVPDVPRMDLPDLDHSRRLDLTDEEVIRLATNFHPHFAPRFNAQTDCNPGRWSETFMMVLGMIERYTGKVEQIERIIMASPMVLQAPPSSAGETRIQKAQRNFRHVLSRVRAGNNGVLYFSEHGREQLANIQRNKEEQAAKAAEEIRKAEQAIAGISKGSASILTAFSFLGASCLKLSRPPGWTGHFVKATEDAMFNPFMKYAIPATLAVLSAVVSRGYKLPSGHGLNLNCILVAPSATGKTQSMLAWQKFMHDAVSKMETNLSSQPKSRIISSSTSSIQGIAPDFIETPSVAWFVEECAALLNAMSHGTSVTDAALRDSFNMLYDCSQHGIWFSPPRSVTSRKSEIVPVNNLNVSTYWTTTPTKFDVFNDDALDGFLSRVIVIRHVTASGDIRKASEVAKELPGQLAQILIDRMNAAKKIDEAYMLAPATAATLITTVSTAQVDDPFWQIMQVADKVKVASLNGDLPPAYTAVSRVPITAQRIAALLAVIDNPYSPSITEDQLRWAVGYLLQNLVSTLSDMDTGEMGVTSAHDNDVVVKVMKSLLTKQYRSEPGVPKGKLIDALKKRAPFKDAISPADTVNKTLFNMVALGRLREVSLTVTETSRKHGTLVCPTDDDIWSVK